MAKGLALMAVLLKMVAYVAFSSGIVNELKYL